MSTNDTINVANTILSQIGRNSIMCLGVPPRSIIAIPETDKHLGGVQFRFTNCPKVRSGIVIVILDASDTYTVEIRTSILGSTIYKASNIYAEDLGGRDGVIEQMTG